MPKLKDLKLTLGFSALFDLTKYVPEKLADRKLKRTDDVHADLVGVAEVDARLEQYSVTYLRPLAGRVLGCERTVVVAPSDDAGREVSYRMAEVDEQCSRRVVQQDPVASDQFDRLLGLPAHGPYDDFRAREHGGDSARLDGALGGPWLSIASLTALIPPLSIIRLLDDVHDLAVLARRLAPEIDSTLAMVRDLAHAADEAIPKIDELNRHFGSLAPEA